MPDVVELTKALIAAESVTPARGAVFDVLEAALVPLGFAVDRFVAGAAPDGPVENLLATRGAGGRHFAFAGHLDVVPPGKGWPGDAFVPRWAAPTLGFSFLRARPMAIVASSR